MFTNMSGWVQDSSQWSHNDLSQEHTKFGVARDMFTKYKRYFPHLFGSSATFELYAELNK